MAKHDIDFFDQLIEDDNFDEVVTSKKDPKSRREIERRREQKELDRVLKDLDWDYDLDEY